MRVINEPECDPMDHVLDLREERNEHIGFHAGFWCGGEHLREL